MAINISLPSESIDPEEDVKQIRNSSWLSQLFYENKLTFKDKQEVLKRVYRKIKHQELADYQRRNLNEILRKKGAD